MIPMNVWFDDLEIGGREPASSGIVVTDKGIDGWYDLPGMKTAVEERVGADGAFALQDRDLMYSARTVTFNLAFIGDTREEAIAVFNRVNAMNHQIVRVRVLDVDDTWVEGWIESKFPPDYSTSGHFAVTVHANNPCRYATDAQQYTLLPGAGGGAFQYVVTYPIDYGTDGEQSSCVVVNPGSTGARPVITVTGSLPAGFLLVDSAGKSIHYTAPVLPGAPVTIDCARRVATANGVSVSQHLQSRDWFIVPAQASLGISFITPQVTDTAFATVTFTPAWI